jgi:hypothetical protein
MEFEPCNYYVCKLQFKVESQVVQFASRYITLLMNRDPLSHVIVQLPAENSKALSRFVRRGRRLSGHKAVLVMNDEFRPKTLQLFR